ncbi:MAG TPA: nitrilase-related carbon-nitrogen hydrolase [Dictyobacter sp.]|jgi:predicted amidohydrolase|nr:nitrilase-related carbon-nitrogen hydrolase [Dictyobacter sp.]
MSTLFTDSASIPVDTTYRVAAIQYEPLLGEKETNVQALLALAEDAATHGARLIVLPAMATTGYCWVSRDEIAPFMESIPGPTTAKFQQLAATYNCFIALGLPEVDPDTQIFYNSVVLLGPDGIVGSYRSLHSSIAEPRWARDGDLGLPVWDTPLGKLSILIGMDAMYFETARLAAVHGADVLILSTAWSDDRCPSSWWMARAFENGVYCLTANRYGQERGLQFSGGSSLINPDGSIQSYLARDEGIVYGTVDLTLSRQKRWANNTELLGNPLADRRPEEYQLVVQNSYLWEPLRFHGLYETGQLPTGQLSGAGIVQLELQSFAALAQKEPLEQIQIVQNLLQTLLQDNEPAVPDLLVLPELLLPGPVPSGSDETAVQSHFRQGAIQIPGPETEALVALANTLQVSMALGVAEVADQQYYNTVLLIDPEGVYGIYRKMHLTQRDRLWATPGNLGLPTFDTPSGRIGLATGYDVLFPETLRILASKGTDIVCAPTLLGFPEPVKLAPVQQTAVTSPIYDEVDPYHFLLWRVRAAEHNVYLALANWYGQCGTVSANGLSGIFSPNIASYPRFEVLADEHETGLLLMTVDTREQRTGRRTTRTLEYSPGDMAGSLTGELAYNVLDSIPGNTVRSKPLLRKRQPFWYRDLVRKL